MPEDRVKYDSACVMAAIAVNSASKRSRLA
jgi:hypothetical protein